MIRGGKGHLIALLGAALFALQGCGEVTWFVFWNTGNVDGTVGSGAVLIIGTPVDPLPLSVKLIAGEIPPGMELMEDATVQGIPTSTGNFIMDIEVVDSTGTSDIRHMEAVIE